MEDLAQAANRLTWPASDRPSVCSPRCTCPTSAFHLHVLRFLGRQRHRPPHPLGRRGRGRGRELHRRGFRHILLVSGEHARIVNRDYLVACVGAVAPRFAQIELEVQVWDTTTYRRLVDAGCDGVTVYQEAYDPGTYAAVHLKGKKRNYAWRLAAPDRAAEAGMRRLGIGALLGLHPDWRSEAIALAAHARALIRRWWRCEVQVALPRLRPPRVATSRRRPGPRCRRSSSCCAPCGSPFPTSGISLSTREPAALRDALVPLGITTMSAGSHTEPGVTPRERRRAPVRDRRHPHPRRGGGRAAGRGYDPVWKDWQRA